MLYVVATPIGNLDDITLRAIEVLKSVDVIYCEDTRHSAILLDRIGATAPRESFHHHTSPEKLAAVVRRLEHGEIAAYITDAGTPGVADPIGLLAEACHKAGVTVTPIPGPATVAVILSVAGLPANTFWFAGFVPTKKGRQTYIKELINYKGTIVIFETAPRLLKFLDQFIALGGGDKKIVVGRELTKKFEEILTGTAAEHKEHFTKNAPKGEFVIAIA